MTVQEVLRLGRIETLDREVIIGAVLKKDRTFLLAHPEAHVSKRQAEKIKRLIKERETNKPLAYILGKKEFFNLPFSVNRFTLIPRPETELLVESALNHIKHQISNIKHEKIVVVDVGTGSGNIIISIAKHFQDSKYKDPNSPYHLIPNTYHLFGIDISKRALQVAQKNAKRHSVEDKISFVQSDLLKNIQRKLNRFDELLVIANLPYLSHKLYTETEPTVQNFEPKTALVSGVDGLDHYRRLLVQLRTLTKAKKVSFWLEISPEQAILIPNLLSEQDIAHFQILADLTGRPRLVTGSF